MNTSRIPRTPKKGGKQVKPAIPTHKTVDWSSLQVGVDYEFRLNVDFDDFTVMRNRAHNAAKRCGFKASTKRDRQSGVLTVRFLVPSKQVSRKRTG